jgi:replicative DNA helicase
LKASEGWEKLEHASKHLKIVEGGDALSRQASAYTVDVLARAAQTVAEDRGMPPLIILDYLQRVPAPPEMKIKDVRERVGYASGVLQVKLARDLQAPVLTLSSVGRASYRMAETDLEGRLGAFKEAGEVEYTAYTALLLYNLPDKLQGEHALTPGIMNNFRPMVLDLVKNREGGVGQIGTKWIPARGEWKDAVNLAGAPKRGRS